MAITKIDTDMIANDAITADKIAAGALDTQLAGYLSTNSFATESYVGTAISNLVDSSPATLDTLNELAAALGDDPNFATTTATAIGLKAPLASPSFTGAATFSGNVGIGGAATDGTFQVKGTGINTGITNVLIDASFADASNATGLTIGHRTDETTAVIAPRTATGNLAFYNYNGGWSETMRLTNTGNVGIGVSPTAALDVKGSTSDQLRLRTADTEHYALGRNASTGFLDFYGSQASYAGYTFGGVDGERMRIDGASGNLLVGTTTTNIATEGIVLYGGGNKGVMTLSSTAMTALYVNRSNDGELVQFRQAGGTTVGSILSSGGDGIIIQGVAAGSGLLLHNSNAILPARNGNAVDATIDLGRSSSSAFRFKDLHLAGNAKASNLQLLEGTTQTGGVFKEKDLLGAGTSTATSIFSETGSGIKFFVNGSVPAVATIYSTGAAGFTGDLGVSGALSVGSSIIAPSVYANYTGGSPNMYINPAGLMQRVGSSLRYKNTVNDATHGLAELLTLRPVTYKGNNDGDTIFGGLIAEEVHDAGLTEFVQYSEEGEPDGLGYGSMVSLCIKAIQEQQTIIQEQQALTAALTARIEALEGDL